MLKSVHLVGFHSFSADIRAYIIHDTAITGQKLELIIFKISSLSRRASNFKTNPKVRIHTCRCRGTNIAVNELQYSQMNRSEVSARSNYSDSAVFALSAEFKNESVGWQEVARNITTK